MCAHCSNDIYTRTYIVLSWGSGGGCMFQLCGSYLWAQLMLRVSAHQGLCSMMFICSYAYLGHILTTAKKEKRRCTLLFWTSLLPTEEFQERIYMKTLAKSNYTFYEWFHSNHIFRMPPPSCFIVKVFLRRLHPTEAWSKAAIWVLFLHFLYNKAIDRFLTVQRGSDTALDAVQVPHCDHADDIALTSNTAESLQLQLNKFCD